jgi:tetratricopeptide (TPR) repeat protein
MTSLATKAHKGRSTLAKARTKKAKKAASKKVKPRVAVSKKRPASKRIEKRTVGRKTGAKVKAAKRKTQARGGARTARSRSASRESVSRVGSVKTPIKPVPLPPKKPPTPEALAAVRLFEQALKTFNRHDYHGAKNAFENILNRFGDETEVVAGVRTYLAICEQRLVRMPSVPKGTEAQYDRGVLEFNKGNTQNAIGLFEKALRSEPRGDHIMYSLATAYARVGNVPKTLDYLRRAIAIRPVHRSHARRDPDLVSLHNNEDFQQLVGLGLDQE